MADVSRLINAMKVASKVPEGYNTDIVTGTVTSVKPLKVKIGDIELTDTFLVVGALCTETKIKVPNPAQNTHKHKIKQHTTQPAGSDNHVHDILEMFTEVEMPEILLWRGLKVGDVVYMIRFNHAQQYFILQRKEGVVE